jgi:hypothetical protein
LKWLDTHYRTIGEIKHLLGIFLSLSKNQLLDKTDYELEEEAMSCIESVFKDSNSNQYLLKEAENFLITNSWNAEYYENYGFQSGKSETFKKITCHINKKLIGLKINLMESYGKDLENVLQDKEVMKFYYLICVPDIKFNPEEYSKRFDYIYHQKYIRNPVLKYLNPTSFLKFFLSLCQGNSQGDVAVLSEALRERYQHINNQESTKNLLDEIEWLESVKSLLTQKSDAEKGTISGYCARKMGEDFGLIISNLRRHSNLIE